MQKVVLDTNVIVSALLSPFGQPARILDLVLTGKLLICFESRIVSEYLEVLSRPRFGFEFQEIAQTIHQLIQMGISVIAQPSTIDFVDESDRVFFDVAQAANALLITGNLKHYPPDQDFIYSPAELCQLLGIAKSK